MASRKLFTFFSLMGTLFVSKYSCIVSIIHSYIADLSILTRFDEVPFNNKVAIGSLFVRHTPMARRFMRRFGTYLAHCITENKLVWGLDQAAFYVVYRMMAFNGETVALASLPEILCDFDFGNDSDVWAAKGNRKENKSFEQESSRLLGLSA